jgi:hypothetical protein
LAYEYQKVHVVFDLSLDNCCIPTQGRVPNGGL